MSNNGMNYPMYNTFPYSQIIQQRFSQPSIPQYEGYQIYSSIQTQSDYNHFIQSTTETLAAFTRPSLTNNHSSNISQQNSNRRLIDNSLKSTSMYYCEICRIACGGYSSYQAHLNGSKHKKKEINSHNQQINQNIYQCKLCDIICTSSDAYKSHIDGNKHDKALKLYHKLGKTIPQILNQSDIIEDKKLIENNNIIKLIGIEYIQTSYDNTNIPKSYYCKLCDCKFNDSNAKDAHLKGKRHRLSYKKKVNPNFQIDNTKLSSSKQNSNEIIENQNDQQINIDHNTKYLMMLHEQIIPTKNLLNIVEQFLNTVESALKSCSDQLSSIINDNSEIVINKSPLMGVCRIDSFVKNLMIKSDRIFYIVVICTEWPRKNLYEKIFSLLYEIWKNQINIQCKKIDEIIQVYTNTNEGQISVSISFTSLSIQEQDIQISEEFLTKKNCFNSLYAMHSVRWFQNKVSTRQHASALIRCLRYKTKISLNWKSLSSEAIEILIEHILSKSISAIGAFRGVLEYLSGGLILPNGPGLRIPWQTDSIKDVFENLSNQERIDITHEAQMGLRYMAFGQLNKWLEQCDIPQVMKSFEKRPYFDDENQVSAKRQCKELENIEEQ